MKKIPPKPEPGLVLSYAYLWADEHKKGQTEGRKDRPAAIVLVNANLGPSEVVYVVPITHTLPDTDDGSKIAIPRELKERLGLDHETSWVDVTEVNVFVWPGPDLRPIKEEERSDQPSWSYGYLPSRFFEKIKLSLELQRKLNRVRAVNRGS